MLQCVLGRGEGGIAKIYVLGIIEGTYVGMCGILVLYRYTMYCIIVSLM